MKRFVNDPMTIGALALTLGVSTTSLQSLQVAWSKEHHAFAAPMRDGDNNIIGIHLRGEDYKVAVKGSRNGAFIPQIEHDRICFLPEGLSNTAALVTMNLFAIGRPSCSSGGEIILSALKRLGIRKVCIVADGDEKKYQKKQCEDCKGSGRKHGLKCYECSGTGKVSDISKPAPRPGYEGAEKLKKELRGIQTVTWVPPSPLKGIRDFMIAAGPVSAKKMIEASISQKIWS